MERNFVADVVVGHIVELGAISGIVSGILLVLLDLLLKSRNVSLVLNFDVAGDGEHSRVVHGLSIGSGIDNQVIALVQLSAAASSKSGAGALRVLHGNLGNETSISTVVREVGGVAKRLRETLGVGHIHEIFADSNISLQRFQEGSVINTRTPCSIAKRATGRGLSTRKNLVCGVSVTVQIRVGTWNRHINGISIYCHSGGGAGETGDGHCRGGCHSDEAFENLIHCSPFLSCLKS